MVDQGGLDAVAAQLGEPPGSVRPLAHDGIFNAVYLVGSRFVLRVPRRHPAHFAALATEAVVVPVARAAGVRTPALVWYDARGGRLGVPYAIYERIPGDPIERPGGDIGPSQPAWRELGRDLAGLHLRVAAERPAGVRDETGLPDPEQLVTARAEEGWLTVSEARWIGSWLDRLASMAAPGGRCLIHGDIQASNVLADHAGTYLAVIDWGGARWDDPAHDFAGVPLSAVPAMLAGYRQAGADAAGIEPRILRRHLQLALYLLRRGAVPGRSWAERGVPMLLETIRFFTKPPPGWRDLGPPE